MNYSEDYVDLDGDWEYLMERAQDHLERLLADLVVGISTLAKDEPFPNCTREWYLEAYQRKLDEARDVAAFVSGNDAFGYAEKYVGDLSRNGDD